MIDFDKFCKRCRHYQYDISKGIQCGLTQNTPSFEGDCKDFVLDFEKEEKLTGGKGNATIINEAEGMTGGEWVGTFLCTPYGLIKYFDWKKEYPRKSKQVCTLYLILLALNILFALCQVAMQSSGY